MPAIIDNGRTATVVAPPKPPAVSKPKAPAKPKTSTSSGGSGRTTQRPISSAPPRSNPTPTPTQRAPVTAPPAEKPGPVTNQLSQAQYLAKDPTYLQALANIQKQVATGTADYNTQIDMSNQDQAAQLSDFDNQRKIAMQNMLNDFSARGLDTSSLYSDAQSQYNQQADSQRQSIMDAIARRIQASQSGITDLGAQGELDRQNALQAAVARYQQSLAV